MQDYVADLHAWWLGIIAGLIAGAPALIAIAWMTQLTRSFPVQDDGPQFDPSAADLYGGLTYWAVFVTGMIITVALVSPILRAWDLRSQR